MDASPSSFETHDAELGATPQRRPVPVRWIGMAAAVVVVGVVGIVMLRGGKEDPKKSPPVSAHEAPVTEDVVASEPSPPQRSESPVRTDTAKKRPGAKASGGAPAASRPPEVASAVTDAPATTGDPEPAATVRATPAPAPAKKPAPTLGGKRVVLEYDASAQVRAKQRPRKNVGAAPTPKDDAASVGAARNAYADGNLKLFAGDADGAIGLYRQALVIYPGYVAGYRGLGLAYAQKGDKAKALKAFRTYISAVPTAKDVPLIKKRIAALQHR